MQKCIELLLNTRETITNLTFQKLNAGKKKARFQALNLNFPPIIKLPAVDQKTRCGRSQHSRFSGFPSHFAIPIVTIYLSI